MGLMLKLSDLSLESDSEILNKYAFYKLHSFLKNTLPL